MYMKRVLVCVSFKQSFKNVLFASSTQYGLVHDCMLAHQIYCPNPSAPIYKKIRFV